MTTMRVVRQHATIHTVSTAALVNLLQGPPDKTTRRRKWWAKSGLGPRMRAYRRSKGKMAWLIADIAGYSTNTISVWECGYNAPTRASFAAWMQALEI